VDGIFLARADPCKNTEHFLPISAAVFFARVDNLRKHGNIT
jgi:hypothetical protein